MSSKEKGLILSLFYWGYLLSPVGSLIANRIGAVETFGAGVAFTALLTIASPLLLSWNLGVYAIARIFEGVFEVRLTGQPQ